LPELLPLAVAVAVVVDNIPQVDPTKETQEMLALPMVGLVKEKAVGTAPVAAAVLVVKMVVPVGRPMVVTTEHILEKMVIV
jgi:hypothetical protein